MKTILFAFTAAVIAILTIGCSENVPKGLMSISVQLPSGLNQQRTRSIGEIIKIRATVTNERMNPVSAELAIDHQTMIATGKFYVPAGENRKVTIEALNSKDAPIYAGSVTTTVTAGIVNEITVGVDPVPYQVEIGIDVYDGAPSVSIDPVTMPLLGLDNYIISGNVVNADPKLVAVAVYLHTNSGWISQPVSANPGYLPNSTGKWVADIISFGSAGESSEIRAFLIKRDFVAPTASNLDTCPDIPEAFASATVTIPQ